MERLGHRHQSLPAKHREDLPAQDRAAHAGDGNGSDQHRRVRSPASDGNAAEREHNIAGSEG